MGAADGMSGFPASPEEFAEQLQELRRRAGNVSYGEIAARITRSRTERGQSSSAVPLARSTVYDLFRPTRSRRNSDLVAEVVRALGADEHETQWWRRACTMPLASVHGSLEAGAGGSSSSFDDVDEAPYHGWPVLPPRPLEPRLARTLFFACLCLNLVAGTVVARFGLPLWFDMIGTAIIAICLGPWHGAAIGLLSNVVGAIVVGPVGIPYALVNMVGALVWAFGVRSWRMGRSPLRFMALNILVAVCCTLTAVPITVLVYGGVAGHGTDYFVAALQAFGEGVWQATFSSNLVASVLDKLIAGYAALGVVVLLTRGRIGRRAKAPSTMRGTANERYSDAASGE